MNSDKETQKEVFARQILRAVTLNKPIVVHSRDAGDDTYTILKDLLPPAHPVHVHCFTGMRKEMGRKGEEEREGEERERKGEERKGEKRIGEKGCLANTRLDAPEVAAKMVAEFPNLFFGFTGVITYNDEALRGIVRDVVPMDRILLETDAPYLTPKVCFPSSALPSLFFLFSSLVYDYSTRLQGANSKVNHPGNIPLVAQAIAMLKGLPIKEVYDVARANTKRCYGILLLLFSHFFSSPPPPHLPPLPTSSLPFCLFLICNSGI